MGTQTYDKIGILIDPGHLPGYNRGAYQDSSAKWYYEGTKMAELGDYLKEELEKTGIFRVVMSKTGNDCPELNERCAIGFNVHCRILLSLHSNAANGRAQGTLIFGSVQRKAYDSVAKGLTQCVADVLKADNGKTYARNVVYKANSRGTDYYGIPRYATAQPGYEHVYLIEHAFHDNLVECTSLYKSSVLKDIAKAEAKYLYELMLPEYIDPAKNTFYTATATAGLNVRVRPSTENSLILGTLTKGAQVEVVHKGDEWTTIRYYGSRAYVSSKYLDMKDIIEPVTDSFIKAKVTVNASVGLNVREKPSTASAKLKTLANKSVVAVDLTHSGDKWYALYPYPESGYISKSYATLVAGSEETIEYKDSQSQPTPETVFAQVTPTAGLNIRSGPGTKYSKVGFLKKDTIVKISNYDTSGTWAHIEPDLVSFGDGVSDGYASAQYLAILKYNDQDNIPNAPNVGIVNARSGLNLRTGASTSSTRILTIPYNTYVALIGEYGDWYQVNVIIGSKQYRGYINKAYITVAPNALNPGNVPEDAIDRRAPLLNNRKLTASEWFINALGARISSGYGYRVHPITGAKQSFHQGIDFAAPGGTPIPSPIDGVVYQNYYNSSYGNLLILQNVSDGSRHYFAHQQVPAFPKVGTLVKRGMFIGKVGTTGSSTGNHLHYEIRLSPYVLRTNNIHPDLYDYSK